MRVLVLALGLLLLQVGVGSWELRVGAGSALGGASACVGAHGDVQQLHCNETLCTAGGRHECTTTHIPAQEELHRKKAATIHPIKNT